MIKVKHGATGVDVPVARQAGLTEPAFALLNPQHSSSNNTSQAGLAMFTPVDGHKDTGVAHDGDTASLNR
jgi:hypothetical protein